MIDPQQLHRFLAASGWLGEPGPYPMSMEYTHPEYEGSSVYVRCTDCYMNFLNDEADGLPIPDSVVKKIKEAFPS